MGCRVAKPQAEAARAGVARATGRDHALLQIKVKRDELMRRRSYLAQRLTQSAARAREFAHAGDKELAMQQLARRRLLQEDVQRIDGRLALLTGHISRIETLIDDNEVAAALRTSNETIRELMEQVDLAVLHEAADLGSQLETQNSETRAALDRELQDPATLLEYEQLGAEVAAPLPAEPLKAPAQPRAAERFLTLA